MAPHGTGVDLWHDLKITTSTAPVSGTATVTGTGVDTQGWLSNMLILDVGACANLDGSNYYTVVLQESAVSGSGYATVADAQVIGPAGTASNTAAINNQTTAAGRLYRYQYLGQLRYIRLLATLTGSNAGGSVIGILAVQGNSLHLPALTT